MKPSLTTKVAKVSKVTKFQFVFFVVIVTFVVGSWQQLPAAQAPKVAPMHVHHVHLNSVNPAAAAAYYPKPFAATATKTTFNGYEAVKTGNVYLLFTKVAAPPQNELTGPQTAVWHFGWNTPDSRKYDERFRAMGLQIAQMWDAADGKLVDMSSDTLPGLPTQEQILEMRAKEIAPLLRGEPVPEARATLLGATALEVEWVFPERRVLRLIANLGAQGMMHKGPAPDWGRQIYPRDSAPATWSELAPWTVRWYLSEVTR